MQALNPSVAALTTMFIMLIPELSIQNYDYKSQLINSMTSH